MVSELQQREILRLSNEASQKLSRECLEMALFKLMAEKGFEKLSISEIVELAGVSRNAFYRNYGTKEALLDGLANTIARKLREAFPDGMDADAVSYSRFFEVAAQNADAFHILLRVRYPLAARVSGEGKDYVQTAWEGAFFNIAIQWYKNGMKETPAEMGELCEKLLARHCTGAGDRGEMPKSS